MRLAIADPPYPPQYAERRDRPGGPVRVTMRSRARRYYGDGPRDQDARPADFHPDAGDWDDPDQHRRLLEVLEHGWDGWAIATTLDGLDHYGRLPAGTRTLVWHNTLAQPHDGRVATTLEAVIVRTPLERRRASELGQVPQLLSCASLHGFPGAKPPAWTRWVLDALAYDADHDTLDDLFPGSGAVAAAAAQGVLL